MPTINFISVDEFRTANPSLDLSKYDDTTLSGVITRATARVESYLEHTLLAEDIVNEKNYGNVNNNGDIEIFTDKYPVNSISEIKIVKGSYSETLNLTTVDYDIPSSKTSVVIAGDTIVFDTYSKIDYSNLRTVDFFTQVTYNAGYAWEDRPQDIIDCVSLFVKDEIARNLNIGGASEIRQGGVTIKYSNSSGKSDFIKDAESILITYKRVTGW